jgi:hypothetical protein
MHTFRVLDQQLGLVPAAAARTLGAVDVGRGSEDAFRLQRPQVLEALIEVARIQSTEASNAIEQVVAPRKRIEALVAQTTTPRNRSEAEIAGYRAVLDLIHASARDIPFRPSVVEQRHRDLYRYTTVPAGRWKTVDNAIEEARDGYYEALQAAGHGWHDGRHTVWPWLEYLLGILLVAYREFEDRVGMVAAGRGAKTAAIEAFIRERASEEFTIADVRDAGIGASDSLIGKVLTRLRDAGVIQPLGIGRSAKWRRVG